MKNLCLLAALFLTSYASAESKLILKDVNQQHNSMILELAGSTAAMVPIERLMPLSERVMANVDRFAEAANEFRTLKKDQRKVILDAFKSEGALADSFSPMYGSMKDEGYCRDSSVFEESNLSSCSGTLISETHILTAGHCADLKDMCETQKWLFGNQLDGTGALPEFFPKKDVYSCKKIVKSINVDVNLGRIGNTYTNFLRTDFAIIELDRPVEGRTPVTLSSRPKATEDTEIFSISYPLGLPAKVTFGKVKAGLSTNAYFWTDMPTLEGSSGGPIFDKKTGLLIGVISKSMQTSKWIENKKCYELGDAASTDQEMGTNSNAQMKKILQVIKRKDIPATIN